MTQRKTVFIVFIAFIVFTAAPRTTETTGSAKKRGTLPSIKASREPQASRRRDISLAVVRPDVRPGGGANASLFLRDPRCRGAAP